MAHIIIDRRKNDKGKSVPNRQRYVRHVKETVKDSVKKIIRDGNIKDIANNKNKKVKGKSLKQPQFRHAKKGGIWDSVHPGNKEYVEDDRIDRPPEGDGRGGGASNTDDGSSDSFDFNLTQNEFLDFFFEDLELQDLIKKNITKIDEWVFRRAGFTVDGNPSRRNLLRTMRVAKTRKIALRRRKKIKELESAIAELEELELLTRLNEQQEKRKAYLELELIPTLKRKIKAIPFIDDFDLRFNRWEKVPIPSTQAVMFCIMDVSASMGEWEKEMSKRFFMLLYLFLFRNYERVEIIFIRHTTFAKEVDEKEFFYSKETGGTLVSSSLKLMDEIIKERYNPEQWNIYGCQCSDGDNWHDDSIIAEDMLRNNILPHAQYYAYVEIDQRGNKDSDLWPYYERVKAGHENFDMTVITDATDIYPVFRGLFEKRNKS